MNQTFRLAYPEHFDTVRFSTDRFTLLEIDANERRAAIVMKLSIVVFGAVAIGAHQVLDIAALRGDTALSQILDCDGAVQVFSTEATPPASMTEALARLLARPGRDAFVFSSLSNGTALSDEWANRLASLGKSPSPELILDEACKMLPYREVVEFARRCDSRRLMRRRPQLVGPSRGIATYSQFCEDLRPIMLDLPFNLDAAPAEVSTSRSNAQKWLKSSGLPVRLGDSMRPFDTAYNLRMASLGGAEPVLLDYDEGVAEGTVAMMLMVTGFIDSEKRSRLMLRFNLDQCREPRNDRFTKAFEEASMSDVVRMSSDSALQRLRADAWRWMSAGDKDAAETSFGSLLLAFEKVLLGTQLTPPDAAAPTGNIKIGAGGVEFPVEEVSRWVQKLVGILRRPLHGVVEVLRQYVDPKPPTEAKPTDSSDA